MWDLREDNKKESISISVDSRQFGSTLGGFTCLELAGSSDEVCAILNSAKLPLSDTMHFLYLNLPSDSAGRNCRGSSFRLGFKKGEQKRSFLCCK